MMGSKSICFKCHTYASGVCEAKHGSWVATTGSAFRPPKKNDVKSWKSLYELYLSQRPNNTTGLKILLGFGGNYYWNTEHNPGIHKAPRSLRERSYINFLKEQARTPRKAFKT